MERENADAKKFAAHICKFNLIPTPHDPFLVGSLSREQMEELQFGRDMNHLFSFGEGQIAKFIGNGINVPTLGYLLCPLKELQRQQHFPDDGMVVWSAFDGVGCLLIALLDLGIRVKCYITWEIDEQAQDAVRRLGVCLFVCLFASLVRLPANRVRSVVDWRSHRFGDCAAGMGSSTCGWATSPVSAFMRSRSSFPAKAGRISSREASHV